MEFIEESLGPEWPKKLYPHGAGREWSTEMRDHWKADQAFEVVPFKEFEEQRRINALLMKIVEDHGIPLIAPFTMPHPDPSETQPDRSFNADRWMTG